MKFNKKNRLIKVLFILFLAVACFSIDNVWAEGTCTYTFTDQDGKSEGTRTFTFRNNELYNDGDAFKFVNKSNEQKYKHQYNKNFKDVFIDGCPNKVYAVKTIDSTALGQKNPTITYYSNEADAKKRANQSNTSSVARFYSATLTDKQVCVGTGDDEFFLILMGAGYLYDANAWSEESDRNVEKINAYMANAKKNNISFCDEKSLNAIVTAVNKYNEVVSKDPNAPQNKKEAINKQSGAIEENVVLLKKYTLSNKTNITLPDGNGNLNKCEELISEDLMYVINLILRIIQIGGPILLIILVAVDFGQVVISNDKDAMPKAVSKAIKRGIAAIVIFFVPYFVSLILDWLNNYSSITGAGNCIK